MITSARVNSLIVPKLLVTWWMKNSSQYRWKESLLLRCVDITKGNKGTHILLILSIHGVNQVKLSWRQCMTMFNTSSLLWTKNRVDCSMNEIFSMVNKWWCLTELYAIVLQWVSLAIYISWDVWFCNFQLIVYKYMCVVLKGRQDSLCGCEQCAFL